MRVKLDTELILKTAELEFDSVYSRKCPMVTTRCKLAPLNYARDPLADFVVSFPLPPDLAKLFTDALETVSIRALKSQEEKAGRDE